MNPDVAIELFKITMFKSLAVVAPFLATILVVGILVSLLQTITSIHEQTLVFIPKLLALTAVTILAAPWVIRTLTDFTIASFARMAQLAH